MFNIQVINGGYVWYLRGTTWTSDPERAGKYSTQEDAATALLKAKPFTDKKLFKLAVVVPA